MKLNKTKVGYINKLFQNVEMLNQIMFSAPSKSKDATARAC